MTELSSSATVDQRFPVGFDEIRSGSAPAGDRGTNSPYSRILQIRRYLAARAERGRYFNSRLFGDPAWDMLLELYVAALSQRRVQVSRLAERTAVPMTTTLRWISQLEREGLILREGDRFDARLVLLSLTDEGRQKMDRYFDEVPEAIAPF